MRADRRFPAILALAAVSTTLGFEAMRAFFSTIYYRNLTTLGINESVLWALLLLAPGLLLVPALARRPAATLVGSAWTLAAARLALSLAWGTAPYLALAGLATAAWLVLVPSLLRASRFDESGPGVVAAGIAVGLAADVALVLFGGSADPTLRLPGLALAAAGGAAVAWLAWRERAPVPEGPAGRGGLRAGLAFGAWLFLEFAVLAAPFHVARWNGAPPLSTATASVLGLLIGVTLAAWPLGAARRRAALVLGSLALLAFLLDHGYLHSPLVPALLVVAQAAMVLALAAIAAALSRASPRRAAAGLLAGALFALVALFAFAFAYQFAFVPLSAVWKGRAALFLLVGFFVLAAGAIPAARLAPRAPLGTVALVVALVAPALVAVPALVAAPPEAAAPRAGGDLRVLSFNVHQAFNNGGVVDPAVFVAVLAEEDADVVVLQESDSPRFTSANVDIVHILAREGGYPHVLYGPATRDQNVGLTILSRHPLADTRVQQLPSDSDNRFLVRARIVVNGTDLWVFGVHFALPTEDRLAQVDVLLAEARAVTGRKILVGDFNSCVEGLCPEEDEPRDNVWRRVTAEYADAWNATGRNATDPGYTFGAPDPYQRIDYVFVSAGVTVRDAVVVKTPRALAASDHLPVRADLRL